MQVLWLLWITNCCPKLWSADTSRSHQRVWSIRVVKWKNSSAIHKSTIRNASTGRRVRWLRVSHWWQEQIQAHHANMSYRVTHSNHWYSTASVPCTTRGRERPSSFYGIPVSIAREREEVSLRWITPREHSRNRERLSVYVCGPVCQRKQEDDKVRHHAHVAGE